MTKEYAEWMAKVWKMNNERNARLRAFLVDKNSDMKYTGLNDNRKIGYSIMNFFIDDERDPVNPTDIVLRNMGQVVQLVEEMKSQNKKISSISFDHDLGFDEPTGYDIAKYLVKQDIDHNIFSYDFKYNVHSQNPVGKKNIEQYFKNYFKVMKEK